MAPKKKPAAAVLDVPPKLATPGPGFLLSDIPGIPEAVTDAIAVMGVRSLGDLRPLVESKAATDPTCEPVYALLADLCPELSMLKRYKAGEAFIGFIGGRERMLALMAGWKQTAPVSASVPPPKADDFDESTPPPKGRPIGVPVPNYIELPPGEPIVEVFKRWDADGRIPPGCLLVQRVGGVDALVGTTSGLRLVIPTATLTDTVEQLPAEAIVPYRVRVTVVARTQKSPSRNYVVFAPRQTKHPR